VACATGIPRATITNVINGRCNLGTASIAKLAAYFQVSAGDFIAGAD